MTNHLRRFWHVLILCLGSIALTSCVSVSLSGGSTRKADHVQYTEPSNNFKKLSAAAVDVSWQETTNGNTIAYLSECSPTDDSTLKNLETETISALSNVKILSSETTTFSDREALRTSAEGQVDGVPVQINLLMFKKNNCTYTLSYVGRRSVFSKNEADFNRFVESFRAP